MLEARHKEDHHYFSIAFSGNNQYLEVPSSPFLDLTRDFTIALWINFKSYDAPILDRGAYSLKVKKVWKRGYLELCINYDSECWTGTHPLVLDNFYHIAVVFRYRDVAAYSSVKFYVNGDPDESYEVPSKYCFILFLKEGDSYPKLEDYTNSNLMIGTNFLKSKFLSALVDDVMIWNVALDAKQVRSYVFSIPSGLEDGLVLYYSFNQAFRELIIDTKLHLNGTIHGAPTWFESLHKPLVTVNTCL